MMERRIEARMLCADLVDIQWRDQNNRNRRGVANLGGYFPLGRGASAWSASVPLGSTIRITYPNGELTGLVKYCVFRDIGYFLGVEFAPGNRWSQRSYRPQHMLDPRRVINRAANRLKNLSTVN